MSRLFNECWSTLLNGHHKSVCISTMNVSLPVHNSPLPHKIFNFAERDCNISTDINFTIDLCASHSIIKVDTLTFIADNQGSRICVFQDPNYNRPRIAMNYPSDCASELYTYQCRLFIAAQASESFELIDFFVIPGATNTISATSHAGMRLYEACFPTTVLPPKATDEKEVLKSPDLEELDYTDESLDVIISEKVDTKAPTTSMDEDALPEDLNAPARVVILSYVIR